MTLQSIIVHLAALFVGGALALAISHAFQLAPWAAAFLAIALGTLLRRLADWAAA